MARPPIEFHPDAVAEALAASKWYRQRDAGVAAAFLAELDNAIEGITEAPERWPQFSRGTRRVLFRRFPFFVVYRVMGTKVQVVAVAHSRRKPGYWKER